MRPPKDDNVSSDEGSEPAYHVCDNEPFYDAGTSDENNLTHELNAESMPLVTSIENLSKIEQLSSVQASIEKSRENTLQSFLKNNPGSDQNSIELDFFLN